MIVFLDFDGVLHPFGRDTLENVPALHEALLEFPEAIVVVSSAWRESHSERDLRRLLGPLGPRMAGATPVLPEDEEAVVFGFERGIRQRECEEWVRRNRPGAGWVAIDDFPDLFLEDCESLLLCDPTVGFVRERAEELRERLEAIRRGAAADRGLGPRG